MASIRKSHFVLLPSEDGSVAMHSMKEWLRQNPEHVPEGLDATSSTSQQLRGGLKRLGWTIQETESEFRLLPPGADSKLSSVFKEILDEPEQIPYLSENEETSFGLESQLRDFLAQNLSLIPVNGQHLQLYVDPTGRDGIEFPTGVGQIDLLAVQVLVIFMSLSLNVGEHQTIQLANLSVTWGGLLKL